MMEGPFCEWCGGEVKDIAFWEEHVLNNAGHQVCKRCYDANPEYCWEYHSSVTKVNKDE